MQNIGILSTYPTAGIVSTIYNDQPAGSKMTCARSCSVCICVWIFSQFDFRRRHRCWNRKSGTIWRSQWQSRKLQNYPQPFSGNYKWYWRATQDTTTTYIGNQANVSCGKGSGIRGDQQAPSLPRIPLNILFFPIPLQVLPPQSQKINPSETPRHAKDTN